MSAHKDINEAMKGMGRFTDIHLNVKKPNLSIFFPDQSMPDTEHMMLLSMLASEVLRGDKEANERPGMALTRDSFMVEFMPSGETGPKLLYRVQPLIRHESYALRHTSMTVLDYVKDFKSLPKHIDEEVLMRQDLQRTGGLVVISGSTGCGKTSMVYATITERLRRFGGYCLAIEDPTEIPSAYGTHVGIDKEGKEVRGFLAQIDASKSGGYENAIVDGLRSIPITRNRPIVFIGEIRDGKTAAEMLRFSISGNLVFTTVHADDHDAACQRIVTLAQNGGEPDARTLLSKSLCASINQRMDPERVVKFSSLTINPKIRQAIVSGNYAEFTSEMKQQQQLAPQISRMNTRTR